MLDSIGIIQISRGTKSMVNRETDRIKNGEAFVTVENTGEWSGSDNGTNLLRGRSQSN